MMFSDRLSQILEEVARGDFPYRGVVTMYKGMSEEDFGKFRGHRIPGFLADLRMALTYAHPSLTGEPDGTRVLISTEVDLGLVEDLSHVVDDMCMSWRSDLPELISRIWTAPSSGHGTRGIYYGKPVRKFEVVEVMHGDVEWRPVFEKVSADNPPFFDFAR